MARNAKRAMRLMNKRYKKARVRKFIEKIRRGYPFWFTAVTTPGVELTNNAAERALREFVVQRKIIGTLRNGMGTRIHETLFTLLSTCKRTARTGGKRTKCFDESLASEQREQPIGLMRTSYLIFLGRGDR